MTTAPTQHDHTPAGGDPGEAGGDRHRPLFDLTGIDLSARVADRAAIEVVNPHRFEMALLDAIVHMSPDGKRAIGLYEVRGDQFWVRGHFPNRPMLPGVLMVEAGAQVACYLWNSLRDKPTDAAFLRIEDAVFRRSVHPGEDLFILCQEVKNGRRRFVSDVQGIVGGEIAFESRITGMAFGTKFDA